MRTISQAAALQSARIRPMDGCDSTVPMNGRQRRMRSAWKKRTRVVTLTRRGSGSQRGRSRGGRWRGRPLTRAPFA